MRIRIYNPLSEADFGGMQSETKINEFRAAHEVGTLIQWKIKTPGNSTTLLKVASSQSATVQKCKKMPCRYRRQPEFVKRSYIAISDSPTLQKVALSV